MTSTKLTQRQRELLDIIAQPGFRIDGMSLYGAREFRTAKSLERRGLARIDVTDQCRITEAGRSALQQGGGDHHG